MTSRLIDRSMRALAGASLAAGICACSPSTAHSNAPPPIAVDVTSIQRRTIVAYEVLDGQVDPYLQASLAPQQSGTLVAIYANEGDRVRKGELLAKIDDSVLRASLKQQQGAQTQSVAKLAQSQIQLPITDVSARSALVQAERTLALAKKQQVADAANVSNTKLTATADQTLLGQGYVSETTYQQARAAYVAAQQTFISDNDKLAQDEAAVRQARQSLANTPLQQQVIVENRGSVVQSEGSVQQYRTAIDQTNIVAPFDGVVTARSLDPGSYASPNQAIYQISQIDPIYVDFNVKDTDLAYVSPGTVVSFTTSAHPERRYEGRVASVNAQPATGTLLYRARIVESNPDFSLRGGLQVSVRITKSVAAGALAVPRAAVVQNGSTGTIYAIETNQNDPRPTTERHVAKQINVRLGLQTDSFVGISGPGLRPGMPIVLGQVDNLHDGAPVRFSSPQTH